MECDIWSSAIAFMVIACKLEEDIWRIHEIVLVYIHLYRRFQLQLHYEDGDGNELTVKGFCSDRSPLLRDQRMMNDEKQNVVRQIKPLPRLGATFKAWHDAAKTTDHLFESIGVLHLLDTRKSSSYVFTILCESVGDQGTKGLELLQRFLSIGPLC